MSVEAFAMAGVDCMENAIDVCALEQSFKRLQEVQDKAEAEKSHSSSTSLRMDMNNDMAMEWVKMKMREWAAAVASNNDTKANLRLSEILLIMDTHLMQGKLDTLSF
ncbi:hypothetical protein VNO78_28394 [Psophocarpus tetragonolobus]|uniref:Uncharacterized protein n=1 Tax=Psophocarpus tetragonolobus TaxID=3891 RepID=A0AAN9XC99_PSOTE